MAYTKQQIEQIERCASEFAPEKLVEYEAASRKHYNERKESLNHLEQLVADFEVTVKGVPRDDDTIIHDLDKIISEVREFINEVLKP